MSGHSLMMSLLLILASLLLISVVQSKWIQGDPASIDSHEIFVNGIPDEGMSNSTREDDSNADMRLNPTDEPGNNRSLDEVNGKRDQTKGDWGRDTSRWSRDQNSVHNRNVRDVGRTGVITGSSGLRTGVITGTGKRRTGVITGTGRGRKNKNGEIKERQNRKFNNCKMYRNLGVMLPDIVTTREPPQKQPLTVGVRPSGLVPSTNTEDTEHVGIKDRTRDYDAKMLADRIDAVGFRGKRGIEDTIDCMERYGRRWRPERGYYSCRRYLYRLKAIEKSKLRKEKVDKGRTTIPSPKQTLVTEQRQGQTTSPSSIQNKNCLHASSKHNRDSPRHLSQLPKSNQHTGQRFYTSRPDHSASVHDSTATLHQVQKDKIRTQELMKNDAQVQKDNIRTQELLKNDAQVQKVNIWMLELLKHSPRNTPIEI